MTFDPDGDRVAIRFDWGDEDTSDWSSWVGIEETVVMAHVWSSIGVYYIKVQAKDEHEKTSEWSLPHQIQIPGINQAPEPSIPHGPSYGNVYQASQFSGLAVDPEEDSISIRFDWGNGFISDWSSMIACGDSVLILNIWLESGYYYVKIQAMDIHGMTSDWSDSVLIKIGEIVWIQSMAPWRPRESHSSVVFDNKMWVIGGHQRPDEVWSSPDGVNWTCETDSAGFGERDDHRSVVFDNKIWVIGGSHGSPQNDVWNSSDGRIWTQVTPAAQWSPRWDHSSVVFDNKIWILGGTDGGSLYDVWYSVDGINWICATNHISCVAKPNHTAVAFDNKIWVMGGQVGLEGGSNEIWYTADGNDWIKVTSSAPWDKRYWHTSEVYDNKIWIIGGTPASDVWYSSDGIRWFMDVHPGPGISDHSSVIFDNKIWVIGGGEGGGSNLIWYRDIIYGKEK